MRELPIKGLWMPDEIALMQSAFEIILRRHRADPSFGEPEQKAVAKTLVASARDECHDVRTLVRRCEAGLETRH
jgi:hypothetical protein